MLRTLFFGARKDPSIHPPVGRYERSRTQGEAQRRTHDTSVVDGHRKELERQSGKQSSAGEGQQHTCGLAIGSPDHSKRSPDDERTRRQGSEEKTI